MLKRCRPPELDSLFKIQAAVFSYPWLLIAETLVLLNDSERDDVRE